MKTWHMIALAAVALLVLRKKPQAVATTGGNKADPTDPGLWTYITKWQGMAP